MVQHQGYIKRLLVDALFVQFKYRCTTEIKINDTINPILSLITVHSLAPLSCTKLNRGSYM